MGSSGFSISLLALLLIIHCSVFSSAFTLLKNQPMSRTAESGRQERDSPEAGWEQKEEIFVALSSGEETETIDMVQHEDSENLSNSAPKDPLLGLALPLSASSILLFLCVRSMK